MSLSGLLPRPVFLVAAPRSGSTLLFETLAECGELWTLGGEAHYLVEGIRALVPGAPGVDSNRLDRRHVHSAIAQAIETRILNGLRDRDGQRLKPPGKPVRFLEKTPKNALRIPFFNALYPDAMYVHLVRDPAENLSSIMEAWKSGGWITYPQLPGWDGPWSLLLPPGWQALRGRGLAEVAAYQWACTNRTIAQDLAPLPPERRMRLAYADLLADPAAAVQRICAFAGLPFDAHLQARTDRSLPLSRYTHTPPDKDKWRKNEAEIAPLLDELAPLYEALQSS
jgi:hypothetical protein